MKKNILITILALICLSIGIRAADPNTPITQAQMYLEKIKKGLNNPMFRQTKMVTWGGKNIYPLNKTGRNMLGHGVHTFKMKYLRNGNLSPDENAYMKALLVNFLEEYPSA